MDRLFFVNLFRFIILIFFQIILFNKINFLGFLNPYLYILFIILYPVKNNRNFFLLFSFLLGIFIDMFLDSGGIHALASLTLAYFRPNIFKFTFGLSYEYQTVKINNNFTSERISFIVISVFIHHFIMYMVQLFKVGSFFSLSLELFLGTIFTALLSLLIIQVFKPNK
jgi:rod shape-determining protein MreD